MRYLLIFALSLLALGCASFDEEKARHSQVEEFGQLLLEKEEAFLREPLSLERALEIAVTNNYEVRKAEIDRELGKIARKTAFAAFLPQISASAGYNSYDRDPKISSRHFDTQELSVGMPIFMPSTWFLYAAAKHGYAMSGISANYTKMAIKLKVTDAFCNVLIEEDLIKAYEVQLEAAKESAKRIEGLADAGLAKDWEADAAKLLEKTRQNDLESAKRKLVVLKATLLEALGLSPASTAKLSLLPLDDISETDGQSLEALIDFALTNHPLLRIADRQVVMKEHSVRQAFAALIPGVSIFCKKSWTGNELNSVSPTLVSGFSAAWDIFSGVSIAKYSASKTELNKTKLERENTFLSVMVNVISADAALKDAQSGVAIAKRAYEIATKKAEDYEAKSREGLIPISDALDAEGERDMAQVSYLKLLYAKRLAQASLDFAVGNNLGE